MRCCFFFGGGAGGGVQSEVGRGREKGVEGERVGKWYSGTSAGDVRGGGME